MRVKKIMSLTHIPDLRDKGEILFVFRSDCFKSPDCLRMYFQFSELFAKVTFKRIKNNEKSWFYYSSASKDLISLCAPINEANFKILETMSFENFLQKYGFLKVLSSSSNKQQNPEYQEHLEEEQALIEASAKFLTDAGITATDLAGFPTSNPEPKKKEKRVSTNPWVGRDFNHDHKLGAYLWLKDK